MIKLHVLVILNLSFYYTGDLEIASTPPQEISPYASNNYRSSLYTNHSGSQVEDVDVLKTGHKSKHTTPRNSTNKGIDLKKFFL